MNHPYTDGYERDRSEPAFWLLLIASFLFCAIAAYAGAEDRETNRQSPLGLWESAPVSTEVEP